MTVLSLLLAGPMQAWGTASRFTTRATDPQPSKSGVIGLLAAAKGLRRTDPLEDLLSLRFGVRVDQEGELLRDFQTARSLDGKDTMPLSYRFYRADARYVVGLEGDAELLDGLAEALRRPHFPLYLGRRSCPPSEPLRPTLHEVSLEAFLVAEPWRAADWFRARRRGTGTLPFTIDAAPGGGEVADPLAPFVEGRTTTRDEPISFDPAQRQYGWRTVYSGRVPIPGLTPETRSPGPVSHDAMAVL